MHIQSTKYIVSPTKHELFNIVTKAMETTSADKDLAVMKQ